jgi:hypothetical protein
MAAFPEIKPQQAPPEIAALYADILNISGLPMVNLIWRHFATFPGVLDWAWSAVRPLVRSRELRAARERIKSAVLLPKLATIGAETWRQADFGIDPTRIAAIAAAYIHGNLTNIVALTALRLWMDDPSKSPAELTPDEVATQVGPPLGPLPRLDMLTPRVVKAVRVLAELHDIQNGVIPSFYLELAPWPGIVSALPHWLGPLYEPAALNAARASIVRATVVEAAALLPSPGAPPRGLDTMRRALEQFTQHVIPDLIPVCIALRTLLPMIPSCE